MAKARVCQLDEVIPSLPEIGSFDPLHSGLDKKAALFLCTVGFEPRCLTIPGALGRHGYTATRVAYFEYATNRDDNAANRPQLLQHLRSISTSVQSLEADNQGFSRHLRELVEASLKTAEGPQPLILFDISVAANRLLIKCMKVLLEFDIRLTILYAEAAIYHPTRLEYQENPERWRSEESLGLERGVSDVTVSEEYPGFHIDQLPDCVIVFPSFNKERARSVVSDIDPTLLTVPEKKVLWLLGVPHLEEDRWRLDAMREINELGSDVPQYEVSTFDYKDSLRTLDAIYQERVGQYKFTVTPMGSKMQALGAALFCYLRPDVRVVFATPKEYNAVQYTKGCKATWMIDFGSLEKIRESLDRVDMVRIED